MQKKLRTQNFSLSRSYGTVRRMGLESLLRRPYAEGGNHNRRVHFTELHRRLFAAAGQGAGYRMAEGEGLSILILLLLPGGLAWLCLDPCWVGGYSGGGEGGGQPPSLPPSFPITFPPSYVALSDR